MLQGVLCLSNCTDDLLAVMHGRPVWMCLTHPCREEPSSSENYVIGVQGPAVAISSAVPHRQAD